MSSTEAPISITVKTPAGSLITVRAESGEELDQRIATSLGAIESTVMELEAIVRGKNVATPPPPAAAAIAAQFGGSIVSEHVNPDAFTAAPSAGARQCPHGTMTRIHGLTGKFGPYKGHFCPAKQGDPTKCTTQYVKAGSPEFATFVADQTKA